MESVHGGSSCGSIYTQDVTINDFLEGIDEQILHTIQKISVPIVELENMSTQGWLSSPENSPSNSHICESR